MTVIIDISSISVSNSREFVVLALPLVVVSAVVIVLKVLVIVVLRVVIVLAALVELVVLVVVVVVVVVAQVSYLLCIYSFRISHNKINKKSEEIFAKYFESN